MEDGDHHIRHSRTVGLRGPLADNQNPYHPHDDYLGDTNGAAIKGAQHGLRHSDGILLQLQRHIQLQSTQSTVRAHK
jgi:hypothetical protein